MLEFKELYDASDGQKHSVSGTSVAPLPVPGSVRKGAPTTDRIVTLTMIAVVLFFAGFRIFRGVDFVDEGYYNAVAYRFALGDTPFVDQRGAHIGLHQTAFLLFTPLVCLFHWVTGGTQGIVLFLRIMFLVFNISVAVVVYRVLRCTVDRNIALLASLFCIAFSSEWVTFCYNNLGALFLLVGLMLEFRAVTTNGPRVLVLMGLAGLSSGLAVVSYPTMVLPITVSVAASLAYVTTDRVRVFVAFAIGFFLGTAPVAAVALNAGWTNLVSFVTSSANVSGEVGQGGGGQKLVGILKDLWRICFPNQRAQVGVLIIVGLVVLFRRRQKFFLAALASIVFLPLLGSRFGAWGTSFAYLIKFCLWCPLLFFLLRNKWSFAGRLYWCVALPSLVAGFATAWTSANGAINAGVGLVPATIVTIVLLSLVVENAFGSYKVLARFSSMAVLCSLLFVVIFFQFRFIYGEGIPNDLTARVENGPYWGLATSETKAALSRSLLQDLHKYRRQGKDPFLRSISCWVPVWSKPTGIKYDMGVRRYTLRRNGVYQRPRSSTWDRV